RNAARAGVAGGHRGRRRPLRPGRPGARARPRPRDRPVVETDGRPGWVGLVYPCEAMAIWLMRAVVVENVLARREGALLYLPAGPNFTLAGEIKNVVTAVAKAHHYWIEHAGR